MVCVLGDSEFDLIPELQALQDEPEFASLGGIENTIRKVRDHLSSLHSATLKISGQRMSITTLVRSRDNVRFESSSLVEALVQHVLCCAQVTMAIRCSKVNSRVVVILCRGLGSMWRSS